MNTSVQILGRSLKVQYSKAALKQQSQLQHAVYIEMELHFGCLVKKHVNQKAQANPNASVPLNEVMFLSFRPILTHVCAPSSVNIHEDESIKIFEVERPERFVPDWVLIDYKGGEWTGDFGYTRRNAKY